MNRIKSIQNGQNSHATVATFSELLQRKSLEERLLPIFSELLWMVHGCKDADQRKSPLPGYCYNILRVLQKVHFKVLPDAATFGANASEIDWEALGRLIGTGLRCVQFANGEFEKIAPRELSLEVKTSGASEIATAEALRGATKESPLPPESPDATEKPSFKSRWGHVYTGLNFCQQFAFNSGPGAMARLIEGIQKGLNGFLDESGQLAAEHPRDNIYWFLLLVLAGNLKRCSKLFHRSRVRILATGLSLLQQQAGSAFGISVSF